MKSGNLNFLEPSGPLQACNGTALPFNNNNNKFLETNVIMKEAEKILKYKELIIEIQRMWNVKTKVISVIKGATGTISESLRQYLSNIPGKHEIKELQKTSHIGHCTQTAESANVKVQNIFHGRNNITCSTDCKYRTAATLFTLQTWFVAVYNCKYTAYR
jgi:hypothetical protein